MNAQLKTVLLTILTLSALTIAIVELSGISRTALVNKFSPNETGALTSGREDLKIHNNFIDSVDALPKTRISFEESRFDFGKIKEGDSVSHVFSFINTGEEPLIISNAIPSCGCTIPSYSKRPVPPGEKGQIEVVFHSANQKGKVHKNIIVVSNAERSKASISFDAEVIP